MPDAEQRTGLRGRLADLVEFRAGRLVLGVVTLTVLLLVPLLWMSPAGLARDDPTRSDVVRWNDEIKERFPPVVHRMAFIAVARDGSMLSRATLAELLGNAAALREGSLSPFLFERHHEEADLTVTGVYTLADAVNEALRVASGGAVDLTRATDAQVMLAVGHLLRAPRTRELRRQLSVRALCEEGLWRSPALVFLVEADHAEILARYPGAAKEEDADEYPLEHFGRNVQTVLRGAEESYRLWGVFLDVNLEIADEGRATGYLVAVAVALVLILIALIFRSWLTTLLCTIGLGMLLVWVKGLSNLLGLKSSAMLDLLVPIAVLVLGIDYAIHALFRYREQRASGAAPANALGRSTYRVSGALLLAMITTIIAFGANASSGIESVVGFGVATSASILAAFLLLGLFVPALVMRCDALRRRKAAPAPAADATGAGWLGRTVLRASEAWFVTLPLVLLVTAVAAWGWSRLEARLDIKEAFDGESDLIRGLDALDEHVANRGGEPAFIYVRGDLGRRGALRALRATILGIQDNRHVARSAGGDRADARAPLLDYLEAVVRNSHARERIEAASGIRITDADGDGLPDTDEQIRATIDSITIHGVSRDADTLLHTPESIRETFVAGRSGGEDAALLVVGVPGTREQAVTKASAEEIQQDMDDALTGAPGITFYGLTGEAYRRDAQFDAIADSLNHSLLIAVAACLSLLLIVFRSPRYAVMTLVPVLLVVCWLYGFMFVTGHHLNMLTATIAAISVGVGIDFSIHFTERFRQEWRRGVDKREALAATARNTGAALCGSALSTSIGFAVISFAPMPMFASFGQLTLAMIALALLMALLVLPSLLLLLAPAGKEG